jgi:hypothetical protein
MAPPAMGDRPAIHPSPSGICGSLGELCSVRPTDVACSSLSPVLVNLTERRSQSSGPWAITDVIGISVGRADNRLTTARVSRVKS